MQLAALRMNAPWKAAIFTPLALSLVLFVSALRRPALTGLPYTTAGMVFLSIANIVQGVFFILPRKRPLWGIPYLIFWSALLGFAFELFLRQI